MKTTRRWLALCLVVWFFPALFGWLGIGLSLRLNREAADLAAREHLTAVLEDVVSRTQVKRYFETDLRQALSALFREDPTGSRFQCELARLTGDFPVGTICVVVHDETGKVTVPPDQPWWHALTPAFEYLKTVRLETFRRFPVSTRILDELLPDSDEMFHRLALNPPGTFVSVPYADGQPETIPRGIMYLTRTFQGGGRRDLIVLFFRPETWAVSVIRALVRDAQTPEIRLGYRLDERQFLLPDSLRMTDQEFQLFRQREGTSEGAVSGMWVKTLQMSGDARLIGTVRLREPWGLPFLAGLLGFSLASGFWLMSLYRGTADGRSLQMSVRTKLVALFLLGIVFPSGISAALMQLYVFEKSGELKAASQAVAVEKIEQLERRFETFCRGRELRLHELEADFRRSRQALPRLLRQLDFWYRESHLDDGFLISAQGKVAHAFNQQFLTMDAKLLKIPVRDRIPILRQWLKQGVMLFPEDMKVLLDPNGKQATYTRRLTTAKKKILHQALGMLGKDFCRQVDRENGVANQAAGAEIEGAMESLAGEEMSGFFDSIKKSRGHLAYFAFRGGEGQHYPSILVGPEGKAEYFWFVSFSEVALEHDFLLTQGEAFRENGAGFLLAIPAHGDLRLTGFPSVEACEPLETVIESLQQSRDAAWVGTRIIQGRPYDVVIRRGQWLRKFFLAWATPQAELERKRQTVRNWALAGWFGMLGIGVSVMLLLSYKLLTPIQMVLASAAGAKKRIFAPPVPVLANDELGVLSREFNRTLVHLADMETAAVIQTRLYPQSILRAGEFEFIGKNRMTQAIGGDYFDYFWLDERRVAFVLADVSGHGVSAALVTTMAKAAFPILYARPENGPLQVCLHLNELFLGILNKKKMMTCCTGVLDTGTGIALLANAGHCSPLLVDSSGGVEFVEMSSSPLGVMKRAKFIVKECDLSRQDLVLYSDCLVESANAQGEVVGFPGFQGMVRELAARNPDWQPADLFDRVQTFTDPVPWPDDATILIIRRVRTG